MDLHLIFVSILLISFNLHIYSCGSGRDKKLSNSACKSSNIKNYSEKLFNSSGKHFPNDFLWSAPTYSYQVKSVWNIGDIGESVWDNVSHSQRIRGGDVAAMEMSLNAIGAGCRLYGHISWSFIDNLEWLSGYSLFQEDFKSSKKTRTLKKAINFLLKVVESGRIPDD